MKTFQEVRQAVGLLEEMGIEDGVRWTTTEDGGVKLSIATVCGDRLRLEVDSGTLTELAATVVELKAIHLDHACLATDLILARRGELVPTASFYNVILCGRNDGPVRELFRAAARGGPAYHPSGLSYTADAQYRGLLAWNERMEL